MALTFNKNVIVLKGDITRKEGIIIDGTPTPGMLMELTPGATNTGPRFKMRVRSQTAGNVGPICILLEDEFQGMPITTAYQDGKWGQVLFLLPGDEVNVRVSNTTGTTDTIAVGDLFGIANDGTLKDDSGYDDACFQAIENVASGDITEPTHVAMKYLGSRKG